MSAVERLADVLSGLALFADLSGPQLEEVAHTFEEEMFAPGQRILRKGLTGGNFYIVLDGEAQVRIGAEVVEELRRGDFFGEISVLLEETPSADVVATGELRCLVLDGPKMQDFLVTHPTVSYRMLQAQARRLRRTAQWRA